MDISNIRSDFELAFAVYNQIKEQGLNYFQSNSVDSLPWFHSKVTKFSTMNEPLERNEKEVVIFSSQRSGSTLFSQLLMKQASVGAPREHFNHAFRGDHGDGVSFNDIWKMGYHKGAISHKIMASDFSKLALVLGFDGTFGEQLVSLANYFLHNKNHFFYRVKRQSFYAQFQSSITAQLSGVYFGGAQNSGTVDFSKADAKRLVNTWLALRCSELVLDIFWEMLGDKKRLVIYENDLRKDEDKAAILKDIASDLSCGIDLKRLVALSPPTTSEQKSLNKIQLSEYLTSIIGDKNFQLYFQS